MEGFFKINLMPGCKHLLGVLAFLMFFLPFLHGQESVHAGGGEGTGTGGVFSYSVGQVAYRAISGSGGMVSQGVQQSYLEIMVGSADLLDGVSIRLFPNPSASFTYIALNEFSLADLTLYSFQLFDVYGHYVASGTLQSSLQSIPTADLISGMYILKVYYQKQPIKTFRFIKTE